MGAPTPQKKENQTPKKTNYLVIGIGTGMSLGIAIGVALGNIGIGMVLGLAIGAALDQRHK